MCVRNVLGDQQSETVKEWNVQGTQQGTFCPTWQCFRVIKHAQIPDGPAVTQPTPEFPARAATNNRTEINHQHAQHEARNLRSKHFCMPQCGSTTQAVLGCNQQHGHTPENTLSAPSNTSIVIARRLPCFSSLVGCIHCSRAARSCRTSERGATATPFRRTFRQPRFIVSRRLLSLALLAAARTQRTSGAGGRGGG